MAKTKKQTHKKKCLLCNQFNSCKLCSNLKKKFDGLKTRWNKCVAQKKCLKKFGKKHFYLFVGIVAVGIIFYNFRSQLIVATVNGQPIFRPALVKELENQAGVQVLDSLITKTVILQEARKNSISITQEAIDAQINEIEQNLLAQNQDLDEILKSRNMTRKTLTDEIRLQLMVEQLSGQEASISEDEINQALEQRKGFMPEPLEASEEAELKAQLQVQLQEQKKSEAIQTWLQKIKGEAKINYLLFPAPVVNQ
jgi:hypothetical protein